jgi:hypothetical protein
MRLRAAIRAIMLVGEGPPSDYGSIRKIRLLPESATT